MGKHTRAHVAQMERLRIRRRRIGMGAVIATGATALGFVTLSFTNGEESSATSVPEAPAETHVSGTPTETPVPQAILDGSAAYIERYGCFDVEDITITIVPDLELNIPGSVKLGQTTIDDIQISSQVQDPVMQKTLGVHETGHACSADLRMFEAPYEHSAFSAELLGSEGFKLFFANNTYASEMDEAFVEWVSSGVEGYQQSLSPEYINASELASRVAEYRGLSLEQVAREHNESDFIGLIALLKDIPKDQVKSVDIVDLVLIFQSAYQRGIQPTPEELELILTTQK